MSPRGTAVAGQTVTVLMKCFRPKDIQVNGWKMLNSWDHTSFMRGGGKGSWVERPHLTSVGY